MSLLDSWLVGKLLGAARLFYCLLVRPLCVVEDILVLGEEGQTPADLRHCVLGDVLGSWGWLLLVWMPGLL